jgi:hypothetical protein
MEKHDWFKLLGILVVVVLCLTGCSTTNITKLTQALAADGAVVTVKVSSIYGTLSVTRVGPQTNCAASVTADGVVTVKPQSSP